MIKHITSFFTCIYLATFLIAQKIEEGYNIMFNPATDGWRYYVVTEKKDDLWYRVAYYLPENTPAMTGWYKDKNCRTADGKVTWYYANKNPKSSINYKNGKEDGMALRFHENGMMSDSSHYANGRRIGISLGWDAEGNQVDSTNFDGKGNGTVVKWYSNGTLHHAGRMTNDTSRINRWNYYHPNGKKLATVDFGNGKVVSCSCSDEKGRELDSSLCVENEPYFPGKGAGWINFLGKNLDAETPIRSRAPVGTYMVMVQFLVDEDGRITEIKPLTKFGFGMEAEVVRILKKSPPWIPAIEFGQKVRAYCKQPVTFVVAKE